MTTPTVNLLLTSSQERSFSIFLRLLVVVAFWTGATAAVAMPSLQDEWRFFCAPYGATNKGLSKAKQRLEAAGSGPESGIATLNYACVISSAEIRQFEQKMQKFGEQGSKGTAPVVDHRRSLSLVKNAASLLNAGYKTSGTDAKLLFNMGMALALSGNELAVNRLDEVIRLNPDSPFAANSSLAMADYFFEVKGAAPAMKYYKMALQGKSKPVRNYAKYKLGWINYVDAAQKKNKPGQKQAITQLARLSKEIAASKGLNGGLAKSLKADILEMLIDFGDQAEASRILKSVGASDVFSTFLERLAFAKLNANDKAGAYKLFAAAQKEQPLSENSLQLSINMAAIAAQLQNVPSLAYNLKMMIISYVDPKAPWRKDRKPAFLKASDKQIEGLLSDYTVAIDQQGRGENKPAYLAAADGLYQLFIKTFPKSEKIYDLKFSYGQLLYVLKKYREAALMLNGVVTSKPAGAHTKEALDLMVTSAQYVIDNDKTKYDLPKPGMVKTELSIPATKKIYADSLDLYVKMLPKSPNAAAMRYASGSVYYDFGHYKDGVMRYFTFIRTTPTDPLAKTAAARILDYYKNQKSEELYASAKAKIAEIQPLASSPELAPYFAKPKPKPTLAAPNTSVPEKSGKTAEDPVADPAEEPQTESTLGSDVAE